MLFQSTLISLTILGNIVDMFVHMEVQARGCPYAHILIWVRNAPDTHTEDGMQRALDEYIDSCVRTDAGDCEEDKGLDHGGSSSTREVLINHLR